MKSGGITKTAALALLAASGILPSASAFEGRIRAAVTRGDETQTWLYTVGTDCLRIERGETNWPHAINLIALGTGEITLVFPHNRSFVRLRSVAAGVPPAGEGGILPPESERRFPQATGRGVQNKPGTIPDTTVGMMPPAIPVTIGPTNLPGAPSMPALPQMPQLPAGVGPQPVPFGATPNAGGGTPAPPMPMMPMMPMEMMEKLELNATGQKTNLLGYACEKFEIRHGGEVMEIWATDKLLPFRPWLANQPPRFGPRMLEEQWGALLRAKKLFPLLAVLKFENGPERLRFEVRGIEVETVVDPEGELFRPPKDYREIEPLQF
ncbi:MAG: DUF4412 domain-containing protein [Verrucomicrobiae bacterium]|nr:DUF4412 domain-containing protein [Verrucomicrobiae bacterium]